MADDWARRLTLRQLRTLDAVARHRSLTRAARELSLTQPAVSMQLKDLEAASGQPLYERVGRGIELTAAGEEVAACAAGVLAQLRVTQERLDALRGLRGGRLRLGATSTAKYFTPALLAAFQADHPDVVIELTIGNRAEMAQQLEGHGCDLVIMGRPPPGLDVAEAAFARHPLVFIAAPDHPLALRRRLSLRELAQERLIIRERGSGTRATLEDLFDDQGLELRVAMEASSNETIKQAVMAGMGLSFISAHTIALEVQTGRLAVLPVAATPVMRDWHALHQTQRRLSPSAAAFLAFLLDSGAQRIEQALSGV